MCVRVSGGFQIGIGRGIRVYALHHQQQFEIMPQAENVNIS